MTLFCTQRFDLESAEIYWSMKKEESSTDSGNSHIHRRLVIGLFTTLSHLTLRLKAPKEINKMEGDYSGQFEAANSNVDLQLQQA